MKKHYTRILLILFSVISLSASAQQPSLRGIYVNGFSSIFGNAVKEDSLLRYAQDSSFNYLAFYDLHSLNYGSSTTVNALAAFIRKAKDNYGIQYIGAVGESYNFFVNKIVPYNNSRSNTSEKFNVFNVEFEFWISSSVNSTGYYCLQYLQQAGCSCDTAGAFKYYMDLLGKVDSLATLQGAISESYVGWFNQGQGQQIQRKIDRVLVHAYRIDPTSVFGYSKNRLSYLAANNTPANVVPIFSAEPEFMGTWIQSNPQAAAWNRYLSDFNADNSTWKTNIRLQGYQWFAYSYLPKPVSGSATTGPIAPTITTSGSTSFCSGGSVILTSSPGNSYLWSNGATTQSIGVSTVGSYTVTVTSSAGTATSSPFTVTVYNKPSATINAGSATTSGVPLAATATAGSGSISSFQWNLNGTAITGETNSSLLATVDGNYSVVVTNSNGCSITSTGLNVTVPVANSNAGSCSLTIPSGTSTTNINATSAIFNWAEFPPCDTIQFRIRREGTNQYIYISIPNSGQSNFQVTGLQPNTKYSWRMRTKCGTTVSSYSGRKSFITLSAIASGNPQRIVEPIVEVRTLVEGALAYPNPAATRVNFKVIADEEGHGVIQITDLSGRIVLSQEMYAIEGDNLFTLDLQGIHNGLYMLSMVLPDDVLTTRLMIAQ